MDDLPSVVRGVFKPVDPSSGQAVVDDDPSAILVHFNPQTLQLTVTNTLDQQGQNKKQVIASSTSKLTMDLIFDTTDTGDNVRDTTARIAALMKPGQKNIPAIVRFDWGAFGFQGMVENYRETLDFFSEDGVPLRASVNLTLSSQDKTFEKNPSPSSIEMEPETFEVPPSGGDDATSVSSDAGDPNFGPALALANALSSMRFPDGPLLVSTGRTLRGPVAFASAGLTASASASFGASAGFGASASFGASAGFGASASAGVSASQGAFAGLRSFSASTSSSASLDARALLPPAPAVTPLTARGSDFALGGRALGQSSAGVRAQVRLSPDGPRLRFEEW